MNKLAALSKPAGTRALRQAIAKDVAGLSRHPQERKLILKLIDAVSHGDSAGVDAVSRHFVSRGALVNAGLIAAAAVGDLSMVRRFHQSGADLEGHGLKALVWACRAGSLECVRYLHKNGVPIGPGNSALADAAAKSGRPDLLEYLAAAGLPIPLVPEPEQLARPSILETTLKTLGRVFGSADFATFGEADHWRFKFAAQDADLILEAARQGRKDAVKRLHESGVQHFLLSAASRDSITAMIREIESAEAIYHPSRFWDFFNKSNLRFLGWGGEANFKRTVNQNYFNFIPELDSDPKVAHLDELERELGGVPHNLYSMEDPDYDPQLWWTWYESYLIFKGDRPSRLALYKRYVATLFEYALREDRLGLLDRFEEPLLGNPIKVRRGSRLVSQDLANSTLELNTLFNEAVIAEPEQGSWFGELGAGYGRIGSVLLARFPVRYAVFDIPPALHISQWYLSNLFPERRIFGFRHFDSFEAIEDELRKCEIAFFTPNQLALIPDRFFLAMLTVSSLHEMRREQISHFLELLGRKAARVMYLKQQWQYSNPHDRIVIEEQDYSIPPGWKVAFQRTDRINPEFFERVLLPIGPSEDVGSVDSDHIFSGNSDRGL